MDNTKKHPVLLCIFAFIVISSAVYCLLKFGIYIHFEEWTGRGLYPSLVLANGFDLYETKNGALTTMYGFGMALFYSLSGLASNPTAAIFMAYILNILGLIAPFYILSRKLYSTTKSSSIDPVVSSVLTTIILVFILQLDGTTSGTLQIHADTPALSFILIALCFFQWYDYKKSRSLLWATSIFLTLAVWAKITTLPALCFPVLYFLLERRVKDAFSYSLITLTTFLCISFSIFAIYGFRDVFYYIIQFPSGSMWSYRNELFDGTNAILKRHSNFEGIPLLCRFFVMYLAEYWYLIFSSIGLFTLSYRVDSRLKVLFRSTSLIAFLTLPTCLAHLARFGAVENALIFTNAFAIIGMLLLLIYLIQSNVSYKLFNFLLVTITFLILVPSIRTAKALPSSTDNSPHQQAFNYLKSGKKDIYFGWYPISHILHSGDNFTSIEVPTWIGMNQPKSINFDLSHIPFGAKYLATSPTGYGNTMLEQYIGKLKEVPTTKNLSSWRLFEITSLSNI